MQKLHTQKLEAEISAAEKERQRETAEQETELAKKLLVQAQADLEVTTIFPLQLPQI